MHSKWILSRFVLNPAVIVTIIYFPLVLVTNKISAIILISLVVVFQEVIAMRFVHLPRESSWQSGYLVQVLSSVKTVIVSSGVLILPLILTIIFTTLVFVEKMVNSIIISPLKVRESLRIESYLGSVLSAINLIILSNLVFVLQLILSIIFIPLVLVPKTILAEILLHSL